MTITTELDRLADQLPIGLYTEYDTLKSLCRRGSVTIGRMANVSGRSYHCIHMNLRVLEALGFVTKTGRGRPFDPWL